MLFTDCLVHHIPPGRQGGENKTAQSKKFNKYTNLITEWKLEREHIPPSFQKRTIWMPDLFGKVFYKRQASKTRFNTD